MEIQARRIRSNAKSTICLSGSAAVYSSVETVGDLDFCEYLPAAQSPKAAKRSSVLSLALRKAAKLEKNDLLCYRIKVFEKSSQGRHSVEKERPWRQGEIAKLDTFSGAAKLDYLAQIKFEGTLEATNMVLCIDPKHPNDAAAKRSFAQQELPIGAWVPRALHSALPLGHYVNWLARESRDLLAARQPKLAKTWKRCFSLARVLFLEEQAEALLDLPDKHVWMQVSKLIARWEIVKEARRSTDPKVQAFERPAFASVEQVYQELKGSQVAPSDPSDPSYYAQWEALIESERPSPEAILQPGHAALAKILATIPQFPAGPALDEGL